MMITKKALSRRTVLRGMGLSLGLPLLDAMIPALSAMSKTAATSVRRFGAVYVPNGMAMPYWTPDGGVVPTTTEEVALGTLSPIMESLAPLRDHVTVVSGLDGAKGANHAGGSTGFLTGLPNSADPACGAYCMKAGTSIDQMIAKAWAQETPIESLQLSLDQGLGTSCDNVACGYSQTISWRSETQPLQMEFDPRALFEQLFGTAGTTDPAVLAAQRRRDRSILDFVTGEVNRLMGRVGPDDRRKVDEYLDSVRDIERRIQMAEASGEQDPNSSDLPVFTQPHAIPATYAEHASMMFDMWTLAMQADLTRVSVMMMGYETSSRSYPETGVPDSHHPVSHHQNSPEKLARLAKINAFQLSLFAKFLEKLRATPDGDGSLLDHSIIIYGAGMSDSNGHVHENLPILVTGGGAGTLKGGRHLKYHEAPPMPNLLLTIASKLGVSVEQVGNSTGEISML